MTDDREGALRMAEQAAVAEEVLSVLRHDVRNKLAAARQAGYYLKGKVEATEVWNSDKRVPSFFALLDEQLQIAETMMIEHAAMAKIHRRAPTALDPAAVAALAVATLTRPSDSLALGPFEPGAPVADENELALALRCLIENALDAAPDGGRVTLVGRNATNAYAFIVTDPGPGLTRDKFRRLSRPLETTKESARGLGLGIARRVAARYGGGLQLLESTSGTAVELRVGDGSA